MPEDKPASTFVLSRSLTCPVCRIVRGTYLKDEVAHMMVHTYRGVRCDGSEQPAVRKPKAQEPA